MLVADSGIGDRPVYSPDGSNLAFVSIRSGYGEIYIPSLDSGSLSQLTYDDVTPQLDGWSNDGWIYFSSPVYNIQGERDILRVRSTGGTPLPIVVAMLAKIGHGTTLRLPSTRVTTASGAPMELHPGRSTQPSNARSARIKISS